MWQHGWPYSDPICNNNGKLSVRSTIVVVVMENSALGTIIMELLLAVEADTKVASTYWCSESVPVVTSVLDLQPRSCKSSMSESWTTPLQTWSPERPNLKGKSGGGMAPFEREIL
jgi:hypothetical protein